MAGYATCSYMYIGNYPGRVGYATCSYMYIGNYPGRVGAGGLSVCMYVCVYTKRDCPECHGSLKGQSSNPVVHSSGPFRQ